MTERITVNFSDEEAEWIEELVEEGAFDSKSKAVRSLVRQGHDRVPALENRVDTLEDRLEVREQRIEDLEEELARRSQIAEKAEEIDDKVDTLATRVEGDDEPDPPFLVEWWQWWRER
jgi:Arc/MetJ-type ribon-helix-helix transcriptional regulator